MPQNKEKATVDVMVNLGELKGVAQRMAKKSGVDLNEFICNALESAVRRERDYTEQENFTPHGGKHLMGKHSGYEVTKDGKYYPSPSWTQQFDLLFAERAAVHNLASTIIQQAQGRLIAIESAITKAKEQLIDELGLDPSKHWVYYGDQRVLKELEETPQNRSKKKR